MKTTKEVKKIPQVAGLKKLKAFIENVKVLIV